MSADTGEYVCLMGWGTALLCAVPTTLGLMTRDGFLQGVPQAKLFPDLDKSTVRLLSAQVDTWGGFIFVNLPV